MESEIEKYAKTQHQLQEQIKELFADKKILEEKIKVLSECLSLKKVKQKISDLENKQKILNSLESLLYSMKSDIKPLEYLKQLLHRELMVSTLSTYNFEIEEQKNTENSLLTVNSECAIETLDSLDDVSSESSESIVVLSEYDVVTDEEILNDNIEKLPVKKVMYHEALKMAASVHSSLASSLASSINSPIKPKPNNGDQMKDIKYCVETNFKDTILMNKSCKSEQLLEIYNTVDEQDEKDLHCNEINEIKLKCDTENIEPTTHKVNKLCIIDDNPRNTLIKPLDITKCDNVSTLLNDSWVRVEPNKLFKISINSEQFDDVFQSITGIQEDIIIPKFNTEIKTCVKDDQFINYQFGPKDNIIKNLLHNNELKKSSNILREYNESNNITEVETHVHNDELCNLHLGSKNINKIESFIHSNIYEKQNSVCFNDVSKDEIYLSNVPEDEVNSSQLITESFSISRKCNDLSSNINTNQSSNINSEKSVQLCHIDELKTIGLNAELLNGIYHHGFQKLLAFQSKYLSYCINKRDIIFHSYPCVGKSIMCFISVLQNIDTSINECQAIILVPTLELAMLAQRIIKSLGIFLNVSTCIGGTNVPRKVSPVPHVVISTLHGLCEMINCNSLCKDFINMLIIDDADEIIKCNGSFNQIREVLLFLNNDRQIIILSTSKFEEILDQFSYTLKNPELIIVPNEKPSINNIIQYYIHVPEDWKVEAICELYEALNLTQTVVYCNSWNKALKIVENMHLRTCNVSVIHNNMKTNQRQHILQQFQTGINRVLVTTGLLRGENFFNVEWVINYDLPKNPKDYVRSIIGYFNCTVKVINFITKNDQISKENIETELNVDMLCFPKDVTDLRVPNLDFINDAIHS